MVIQFLTRECAPGDNRAQSRTCQPIACALVGVTDRAWSVVIDIDITHSRSPHKHEVIEIAASISGDAIRIQDILGILGPGRAEDEKTAKSDNEGLQSHGVTVVVC